MEKGNNMRHEVIMTLDEFNQLKETREQPSKMLQDSYNNVKAKLDLAYKQIDELNASLSMYIIGGAKPRQESRSDVPEVKPTFKSIANKHWTDDELDSLHHSVDADTTVAYLSDLFGRTESSIRSKAISLGYKIKHKRIISV